MNDFVNFVLLALMVLGLAVLIGAVCLGFDEMSKAMHAHFSRATPAREATAPNG